MKKRWIALILICGLLSFQVGLMSGSKVETSRQEQARGISKNWSTTVAVVNADAGVLKDGVLQSYSTAIIETLSDNYALVSPNMADVGYSNGSYGAIITFPTDVSQKILSYNSNSPEKVRLDFVINPHLFAILCHRLVFSSIM